MRWSRLATALGPEPATPLLGEREVAALAYDSRKVSDGTVFVAIPGQHHDGHDFVVGALAHGAALAVVQQAVPGAPPDRLVRVENTQVALAALASCFYGDPSRQVPVLGVTGTDGKTTTTTLIHAALSRSLGQVGSLSTVDFRLGEEVRPNLSRQTTLESLEVQDLMRQMVDRGCRAIILEATSHGLALGRLEGIRFAGAIYTNITHEHLDFHGTWDNYFEAKASLLDRCAAEGGFAVLNRDDDRAFRRLQGRSLARSLTYSARGSTDADLRAEAVRPEAGGFWFTAQTPAGSTPVRLLLAGRWNVGNALAALAAGLLLEQPLAQLAQGLGELAAVPGRMESVDLGQSFSVIVDYAHTPAALTVALHELRAATAGRLWVVFGSAGERDVAKRAEMGRIAAQLADQVVVTSEDPRSEDPDTIIEEIWNGARAAGAEPGGNLRREVDRAAAVRVAIGAALSGDTVLLAGKGHEHSIIGAEGAAPWDERQVAERALRELRGV
ncbi:MAG: UDP-N-acetylmuramoyl-L-alanyl-D-glutamate--2,6-diaminopimelate ligase [Candidatus Dormibacteria bacterium]